MSQCLMCGHKGMLQSVDERGLCKTCHAQVQSIIDKNVEAIHHANAQMNQVGVDFATQIVDWDRILDALEQLQVLEEKGVTHIMQQPIPTLIQHAINTRRQLVEQAVRQYYAQAREAVEAARTPDARIQVAESAVTQFQSLITRIGFSPLIEQAQNEFRGLIYQAEYQRHMYGAELAEKEEKLEAAHGEYVKAESFLKRLEGDSNKPSQHLIHLQNKIQTIMVMIENAKPKRNY